MPTSSFFFSKAEPIPLLGGIYRDRYPYKIDCEGKLKNLTELIWNRSSIYRMAAVLSARFTSAIGVIALSIVLSRNLSTEDTGIFFGAFTIAMGLAIALRYGQDISIVREMTGRQKEIRSRVFWSSFALSLGLSVFLSLAIWAAATFLDRMEEMLRMVALSLVPLTIINIFSATLRSGEKPALGGLLEVGIVSGAATIAFLVYPVRSPGDAWTVFVVSAWSLAALTMVVTISLEGLEWQRPHALRKRLIDNFMLWQIALLSYASQWGSVVIMTAVATPTEIAATNAVFRLLAPLQFVVLTLDAYFAAQFARGDSRRTLIARRQSVILGTILASPYVFIIIFFPEIVLDKIFGTNYRENGFALQIVALGALTQISLGANGILLLMKGSERVVFLGVVLRALISLSLFGALFRFSPTIAACAAFSAGIVFQSIFNRHQANKHLFG